MCVYIRYIYVNTCTAFELSVWDKVIIFNFDIHSIIFGSQPFSCEQDTLVRSHLAIAFFAQQVISIWFYDFFVDTLICRVALFSAIAAT